MTAKKSNEQQIRLAIQERKSIVFTCPASENHIPGNRQGDPHILFQTSGGFTMVHIWKTGGVQTDASSKLPGWRAYHLSDLIVLEVAGQFTPQSTFNPHGKMYATTICSID